ncbi:hypothetical protein [Bosea sp. (in: a-proteobacteria)]|uniref:hypothetical protein n=1 Tax=Bosea sp. (in: a-proteobacteria) TaxID=1871050 RepID=UPI0025BF7052|nr:hypothetical protein [Bosea sp. (in: a-proteobacteria)]
MKRCVRHRRRSDGFECEIGIVALGLWHAFPEGVIRDEIERRRDVQLREGIGLLGSLDSHFGRLHLIDEGVLVSVEGQLDIGGLVHCLFGRRLVTGGAPDLSDQVVRRAPETDAALALCRRVRRQADVESLSEDRRNRELPLGLRKLPLDVSSTRGADIGRPEAGRCRLAVKRL